MIKLRTSLIAIFFLFSGCGHKEVIHMDPSIVILNHGSPLFSGNLAAQLALMVCRDRYPLDVFYANQSPIIEDHGDYWVVIVENKFDPSPGIRPKKLIFSISKFDGRLISIR